MVRPTAPLVQAALAAALLAGCTLRPAAAILPSATPSPTQTPSPAPTDTATPSPTESPTPPPPTATPLPTPAGTITRGPYLQSATSTSIVIVWETDRPMVGEVVYGSGGTYTRRAPSTGSGLHHEVLIRNLEPGTAYGYWIASNGYPISEPASFRTAPADAEEAFSFIAYGDTRTGHTTHRRIAEAILRHMPDFIVHTGDLVGHGNYDSEWDRFFAIEQSLLANVPLFPSPGNHDANDRRYFEAFVLPGNERWYAFDWGNARFISLQIDAIVPFGRDSEQVQWLESTLASNTQDWTIVFFHVPPYDAVADHTMNHAVRVNLVPLFERYAVDLVIDGHTHNYQRTIVNGVTYLVTAGAGAELYHIDRPGPDTQAYYNGHHFVHFSVQGDSLTGTALTADGTIVDTFDLHSRASSR